MFTPHTASLHVSSNLKESLRYLKNKVPAHLVLPQNGIFFMSRKDSLNGERRMAILETWNENYPFENTRSGSRIIHQEIWEKFFLKMSLVPHHPIHNLWDLLNVSVKRFEQTFLFFAVVAGSVFVTVAVTLHLSFSVIVTEFDEFNEFKIWWCHWKKVTYI